MKWIDRTTSTMYFAAYQGMDGQVESVNGDTGHIVIHGENLHIGESDSQSIKDYIDENVIPLTATDDDIDAMFSMVFFSGASFITGRRFESGDSITYKIEALTDGAPMPQVNTTTVYPTGGNSCRYRFGNVVYELSDIPEGETSKTFNYKVTESSHTLNGVPANPTVYYPTVTITDNGNGTLKITKSENFNAMYFAYAYSAMGRVTFEGGIQLNGRSMAAREFMVQIKEGDEIVYDNVSTTISAAHGQMSPISFPPINYTLDDIGTHIYTVRQTSVSGDGVTIDNTIHTVTVRVLDEIRDGSLEIETDGSELNLNFVNTYAASGSITFRGTETLVHRLFRDTDVLNISITGNGKLPSPAIKTVDFTVGEDSADFEFPQVTYTLSDMRNSNDGYDDSKTFVYNAVESSVIPGVTYDGKVHSVTVRVTDNKKGGLLVDAIYNDGDKFDFVGTYNATGTMVFRCEKHLVNRKFVAADNMYAMISSVNGKLPYVASMNVPLNIGQNVTEFNFIGVVYTLSDINYEHHKTFNYIISEDTVIKGATNDTLVHSVDVYVEDNYDGTLNIVPTYSDGNKAIFESIYDASGFIALSGTKTIVNRSFKTGDLMSVSVSSVDGKLPNPSTISVPLTVDSSTANFSFAQITYKIVDLGNESTKVFNYEMTETITMPGTTPVSLTDTVSISVSDNFDGTLTVIPTYTNGNRATFTNVYAASADLSFKAKCVFTNGNMSTNPFTIRVTQVTGNNSTTQATENVVLSAPVTAVANTGNSQDVDFSNIVHFVKNSNIDHTQASYWFMIEEVLPAVDSQGIYNNVKYDLQKKWINVAVSDNFDGTLLITKTPAADISTNLDVTFTNEQLADLTINKVWTGDHEHLTAAEKNKFRISVTGPNDYNITFTYADMLSNEKVLKHLHLGEYTVTETDTSVENYIITTSYSVGSTTTNKVNLVYNGSSINVADNVNILEATLNIVKLWAGDDNLLTQSQKNAVTFVVTGPKQKSTDASTYSRTFTYADMTDGRMTIDRLTLGVYSAVESNYTVTDFDVDVEYTVNGTVSNSVTLADGDNKAITVTDTYTLHRGSVKVSKACSGIISSKKPVNFNITNNYDDSVFTYANADNYDTADGVTIPYEWTIRNVPVHTTIQFTEHNADIADYTLEASAVPANRTSSAVVKNETATVSLLNNYILHVGTVKVTQQFTGITSAQKPANYAISNSYNDTVFKYENADNHAIADGVNIPYEWTITNVPVHTTILFTEHYAEIEDYTLVSSAVPANFTNTAVVKDTTSTVAITNSYTLHTGTVKVTKLFDGITSALKPASFNITNSYNSTVFTTANANNAATADGINTPYEWTITDVPVHTVITFTEHDAEIEDYTLSAMAVPANYKCDAVVKDAVSTVDITNVYTLNRGSVKVTKLFSGITSSLEPADLTITNNYNSDVFTYANAVNAALADGITIPYEWIIADVPVKTVITFTENNTEITGYDFTSESSKSNTPVAKDTTTTVSFVNNYVQQVGNVKVSKLFSGIMMQQLPVNFNITNSYNSATFTYANADNASTADGVTVPYEWTIMNVPAGTTITFVEHNISVYGFDLVAGTPTTKSSSAVVKNVTTSVTFNNAYTQQVGSVKVTKKFSGIETFPENFSISNNYNATVFTYDTADNASTADGTTTPYEWTIDNVPVGTIIQFTENNTAVSGYDLVSGTLTVKNCPSVVKNSVVTVDFVNEYEASEGE